MTERSIIRLRGEGPDLVWPREELRPLLYSCYYARRCDLSAPERDRKYGDVLYRVSAARRNAATAFATAQGWRFDQPPLEDRSRLLQRTWARAFSSLWCYRHQDFFLSGDGLAALVVHSARDIRLDEVPATITVDALPASWVAPGEARAFALRPCAGEAHHR